MLYEVCVTCRTAVDAPDAFALVSDYEGLAVRAGDVVKDIKVIRPTAALGESSWEVAFRRGTLKWSQVDRLDLERGQICFELIAGDPSAFDGQWTVERAHGGATVTFHATFDLGIRTMGEHLGAIAAETLAQNVSSVLTALFPSASLGDVVTRPVPNDKSPTTPRTGI